MIEAFHDDAGPFAWLFARTCRAMCRRISFSNCADGRLGSGGEKTPIRFRVICTGVRTRPEGKPHHPQSRQKPVIRSCCFLPQDWQEICGMLLHLVM